MRAGSFVCAGAAQRPGSLLKKGIKGAGSDSAGSGSLHRLVHPPQMPLPCIRTLVSSCLPAGHSDWEPVVKRQKREGCTRQLGPDFLRGKRQPLWALCFPRMPGGESLPAPDLASTSVSEHGPSRSASLGTKNLRFPSCPSYPEHQLEALWPSSSIKHREGTEQKFPGALLDVGWWVESLRMKYVACVFDRDTVKCNWLSGSIRLGSSEV